MVVSQHDPTNPRFGFSLKGRTAYVAQQAWIQNLSVRDNILFGHAYDAKRYDEVISACALAPDLAILPGDKCTDISGKGYQYGRVPILVIISANNRDKCADQRRTSGVLPHRRR
jgi:hypothetical protein